MKKSFIGALSAALLVAPCASVSSQQPGGVGDPCSAYEDQAFDPQVSVTNEPLSLLPEIEVQFPTVPGWIKSLSPIPSGCGTYDMSEQQHQKVTKEVNTDRSNPPDYNLAGFDRCETGYNCQDWAVKIEALARE